MAAKKNELNVLLVGKTGSGISSTCKSIVPESKVKVLGGFIPVTKLIESGSVSVTVPGTDVEKIIVAATPGVKVGDGLGKNAQKYHFRSVISHAFHYVEPKGSGFDAVVLVISYSERMHREFKDAIDALESVLGEDVLNKRGILLVTGRDNLERDAIHAPEIKNWLDNEVGYVKELKDKCGLGHVLFDNVTDGKEKEQLDNLVSILQKSVGTPTYKYSDFESANEKFVRQGSLKEIKKKTDKLKKKVESTLEASCSNSAVEIIERKKGKCLDQIHEIYNLVGRKCSMADRTSYDEFLEKLCKLEHALDAIMHSVTKEEKPDEKNVREEIEETFKNIEAVLAKIMKEQ